MALEIWYTHDGPERVAAVAELDALVDRILTDFQGAAASAMIQVAVEGEWTRGVLEVGLGPERGFIFFLAEDGGQSEGDFSRTDFVTYDYMGSVREIPGSAEVPMAQIRAGLREFLETGEKPKTVAWSERDGRR